MQPQEQSTTRLLDKTSAAQSAIRTDSEQPDGVSNPVAYAGPGSKRSRDTAFKGDSSGALADVGRAHQLRRMGTAPSRKDAPRPERSCDVTPPAIRGARGVAAQLHRAPVPQLLGLDGPASPSAGTAMAATASAASALACGSGAGRNTRSCQHASRPRSATRSNAGVPALRDTSCFTAGSVAPLPASAPPPAMPSDFLGAPSQQARHRRNGSSTLNSSGPVVCEGGSSPRPAVVAEAEHHFSPTMGAMPPSSRNGVGSSSSGSDSGPSRCTVSDGGPSGSRDGSAGRDATLRGRGDCGVDLAVGLNPGPEAPGAAGAAAAAGTFDGGNAGGHAQGGTGAHLAGRSAGAPPHVPPARQARAVPPSLATCAPPHSAAASAPAGGDMQSQQLQSLVPYPQGQDPISRQLGAALPPELAARLKKKIRIIQPISRTWVEEALLSGVALDTAARGHSRSSGDGAHAGPSGNRGAQGATAGTAPSGAPEAYGSGAVAGSLVRQDSVLSGRTVQGGSRGPSSNGAVGGSPNVPPGPGPASEAPKAVRGAPGRAAAQAGAVHPATAPPQQLIRQPPSLVPAVLPPAVGERPQARPSPRLHRQQSQPPTAAQVSLCGAPQSGVTCSGAPLAPMRVAPAAAAALAAPDAPSGMSPFTAGALALSSLLAQQGSSQGVPAAASSTPLGGIALPARNGSTESVPQKLPGAVSDFSGAVAALGAAAGGGGADVLPFASVFLPPRGSSGVGRSPLGVLGQRDASPFAAAAPTAVPGHGGGAPGLTETGKPAAPAAAGAGAGEREAAEGRCAMPAPTATAEGLAPPLLEPRQSQHQAHTATRQQLPPPACLGKVQGELTLLYQWYVANKTVYLDQAQRQLRRVEKLAAAAAAQEGAPAAADSAAQDESAHATRAFETALQIMRVCGSVEQRCLAQSACAMCPPTAAGRLPAAPAAAIALKPPLSCAVPGPSSGGAASSQAAMGRPASASTAPLPPPQPAAAAVAPLPPPSQLALELALSAPASGWAQGAGAALAVAAALVGSVGPRGGAPHGAVPLLATGGGGAAAAGGMGLPAVLIHSPTAQGLPELRGQLSSAAVQQQLLEAALLSRVGAVAGSGSGFPPVMPLAPPPLLAARSGSLPPLVSRNPPAVA